MRWRDQTRSGRERQGGAGNGFSKASPGEGASDVRQRANVVATMLTHGKRRLLTFNLADFRRYRDQVELVLGFSYAPQFAYETE